MPATAAAEAAVERIEELADGVARPSRADRRAPGPVRPSGQPCRRRTTATHADEGEQELLEHRQIRGAVIEAEREALLELRERGAVSDDVFRRVERDLDLEELRMEA